ncbi:DUF4291 family protein [Streptomyces sp. NPDC058375]|uniref:DUF4291 family protein n=1 Tax=Streptomyces sp. NPDC058375 TaxID=3346467 RepID=UPI00365DD025
MNTPPLPPRYEIRALHTATTVTVYQAYRPAIGLPAARDGRFPAEWKRDRMTWIKPSFLWMMYRDPERDLDLNPLPYRSLQLGLSGEASRRYADEWTVSVRDVTPLAREVHAAVRAGERERAAALLPVETPLDLAASRPVPDALPEPAR